MALFQEITPARSIECAAWANKINERRVSNKMVGRIMNAMMNGKSSLHRN